MKVRKDALLRCARSENMQGDKELVGVLKGFDDYVSILTSSLTHMRSCLRYALDPQRHGARGCHRIVRCLVEGDCSLTFTAKSHQRAPRPLSWTKSCSTATTSVLYLPCDLSFIVSLLCLTPYSSFLAESSVSHSLMRADCSLTLAQGSCRQVTERRRIEV